jgi:hypothetical protein
MRTAHIPHRAISCPHAVPVPSARTEKPAAAAPGGSRFSLIRIMGHFVGSVKRFLSNHTQIAFDLANPDSLWRHAPVRPKSARAAE